MEHTIHHSPNGAGHEHSEASVRLIVVSLGGLAIGVLIVFVLVVGIFRYFYDTDKTAESRRQGVVPPEPRIEVAPYEEIIQMRAHEDHVLHSYAWVDKSTGTVRVPIDRAIDMLATKGVASHNYLDDILAGKKPAATSPVPAGSPAAGQAKQGSSNAK